NTRASWPVRLFSASCPLALPAANSSSSSKENRFLLLFRAMKIFISAGEPSGDLHGANLIRALRARHPGVECVGFGGECMEAAGGRLLYPLCRLAVMWFLRVLAHAPTFLHLLSRADRYFRHRRPDAVVLIDYPGFNRWLAGAAPSP